MADHAIVVRGLSKVYKIGAIKPNGGMSEAENSDTSHLSAAKAGDPGKKDNILWALKDVSFEVERGEAVGIIGKNGAGKSTLLKVLTGITAPSEGRAEIKGRVGSLLEVGTGFHPELTGRENVYLNGAILGMSRAQIRRSFDEIVRFSGVGKFIDTPVKRYSSGMYVRLAFAVAAHLDPEILILDEVLAVGDLQFQKKSQTKMQNMAREKRTVLLVSHNMASVSRICSRTLLLSGGRVAFWGKTQDAIEAYSQEAETPAALVTKSDLRDAGRWEGNRKKVITWISLHRTDGGESCVFETGEDIVMRIGYDSEHQFLGYCQMNILNSLGDRVMVLRSSCSTPVLKIAGEGFIEALIPGNRLLSEEYTVMLELGVSVPALDWLDCIPQAIKFRVRTGQYLGGVEWTSGPGYGTIAQKSQWSVSTKR